jgi:hypothetical protein
MYENRETSETPVAQPGGRSAGEVSCPVFHNILRFPQAFHNRDWIMYCCPSQVKTKLFCSALYPIPPVTEMPELSIADKPRKIITVSAPVSRPKDHGDLGTSCVRKDDSTVPAKRILYVSYNPATLVRDEQLLMRGGFEVDTVFGTDGLMACGSVAEYASILIDDAFPLRGRKKMITWLLSTYPTVNILPATGFTSTQPGSNAGPVVDGICLRAGHSLS